MLKLFFLFAFFFFVNCQTNQTTNSKQEEKLEIHEQPKEKLEVTDEPKAEFRQPPPRADLNQLYVSTEEMDKLLACSYILSRDLDVDKNIINQTAIKLNVSLDKVMLKLSYQKLLICSKSIDNKTANLFFKDLLFIGEKDTKKFSNYTYVDYKTIDANYSLELTSEENFNAYKFEKARTKFEEKRNDAYKVNKNKITVFGYDVLNSQLFKTVFFLIAICILTFGLLYLLSLVMKKPKAAKNKKKKRN